MTFQFINGSEALTTLCQQLTPSEWLAVDTEFLREKTYYPQLCLIQIASDSIIACIDTIALNDLTPLLDIIYNPDTTIVFHAARQDLELLYLIRGDLPQTLFDTQFAAAVLGHGDQISYANLVRIYLDVELDKSHSRTNWSRRPLDPAQIEYAANDVRYLRNIYHILKQQLKDMDRLHWLDDHLKTLTNVKTYQLELNDIWHKIRGSSKLEGAQLAVLQRLAAWRENGAVKSNKPRRWILKDEVMVDLARIVPQSLEKFKFIPGLMNGTIEQHGETLIEELKQAKSLLREAWPRIRKLEPLNDQQDKLIQKLMSLLRKYCDQQSIAPITIASRKDIEDMVRGEINIPLLQGWRNEIIGHHLDHFLKSRLTITDNQ